MNTEKMEPNDPETSLLKIDQFYVDVADEPSDYILVFKNPYDLPEHNFESSSKHLTILADEAEEIVKATFNIDSHGTDEKIYQETKQKILDSIEGVTISMQKFHQELFEGLILLLQEYLNFTISMFYSKDYEEIFVKIQASEHNLQVTADLFSYRLQFKDHQPQEHLFQTVAPYGPFEKHSLEAYPYTGISSSRSYSIDIAAIYKHYDIDDKEVALGSHFKEIDRIRLIYLVLNHAFEVNELINLNFLTMHYPIHRKSKLQELNQQFANLKVYYRKTNYDLLRNYYGEKIALYFAWLQFYLRWLIFPSIIGVIVFIIQISTGGLNDSSSDWTLAEMSNLIFVMLLCISSSFFDQMWARREARFSWRWGCLNMHIDEHQRTEFEGAYGKDPVTGKRKKLFFQTTWMRFKRTLSFSVIFVLIVLVIIFIIAIFWYKSTIRQDAWNSRLIAFFNAVQIKVFNYLYGWIAHKLTDLENYETNTSYNNALAIKLFLFQFVNSYSSLFYIAFFKGHIEGCEENDCMSELQVHFATIFLTILLLNIVELGTPILLLKWKMYRERQRIIRYTHNTHIVIDPVDAQSMLTEYDTPLGDYMEIAIGYGYIIIFAAAFPLVPLIAFVLAGLELIIDAWKLCNITRRPFPERASSIGIWMDIIQALSFIGSISNVAILVFTNNVFDLEHKADKWLVFFILEHCLILLKSAINMYIPNIPQEVQQGDKWSDKVVNEVLYGKISDIDKMIEQRNLRFSKGDNWKIVSIKDLIQKP